MSSGAEEETIRMKVSELIILIKEYKAAAQHARKMKPKPPSNSAKAKAAPPAPVV